jgi:hypothetical protein
VQILNCHPREYTVHIWIRDLRNQQFQHLGALRAQWDNWGSCPKAGAEPFEISLVGRHSYDITIVQPDEPFCGGENDPHIVGCQKMYFTIQGVTGGPIGLTMVD